MNGGAKTCWRAIEAQPTEGGASEGVSRGRRLAAMYRLQNGEPLGALRLVDTGSPLGLRPAEPGSAPNPARAFLEVTDPAEVDWTGFPVLEALEAVARDELRILRSLLDEGGGAAARASLDPFAPPPPRRDEVFIGPLPGGAASGPTPRPPDGGPGWAFDPWRATSSEL